MEEFIFPDLDFDCPQQQVQQVGEHVAVVDEEVELPMPELVEDSSDDEELGEDLGGDDDQ